MIPQYCHSLTQNTATLIKSLEDHDKNTFSRHLASPIITMVALETISILATFYHTVDVIKKGTFFILKASLQKIPTNWTQEISHHFPTYSPKDSLSSSVRKLKAAARAATIGAVRTLYAPKRDQHLIFYTKDIFNKKRNSITSLIESKNNKIYKHIKNNKSKYFAGGLFVSGTLVASYSLFTSPVFTSPIFQYEEISREMAEDFRKNSVFMPEHVTDWSAENICRFIGKPAFFLDLSSFRNLNSQDILNIHSLFKKNIPQLDTNQNWLTCSASDLRDLNEITSILNS